LNKLVRFSVIAVFPFLLLSGCAQNQSSAQRHANHFIMATANDSSGPNFRLNTADSARMATPFFEQFWQQGKKDRDAGLAKTDIAQRIKNFQSEAFTNEVRGKSRFAGSDYNQDGSVSSLWRKEMSAAVSASYMDGYNGVK
jgi:hypothetical protein